MNLRMGPKDSIAWRVKQRQRSKTVRQTLSQNNSEFVERKRYHLRCKAQELAHKISKLGRERAFRDCHEVLFFLNCPEFPYLHLYNPTTLTEFLEECEKLSLYDAAFVAAEGVKAISVLCKNEAYAERMVKSFCHQKKWGILHQFLTVGSISQHVVFWLIEFFKNEIIMKRNFHVDEEEVLACLFEKYPRMSLLLHVAKTSNVNIIRRIRFWKLTGQNFNLTSRLLFHWAVKLALYKTQNTDARMKSQRYEFLTEIVKKGLVSANDSMLKRNLSHSTIGYGRHIACVNRVKLGYNLGLIRNVDIQTQLRLIKRKGFHIDQSHASELTARDVRLIQVEEYIQKAAATPRRLEDLCVSRVSQLVGCREDRELGVEKLGLGQHLTERVLMIDVCREIERGMSSDLDQKRGPPGLFYCYKSIQDCLDILGNR